MKNLIVNIFLVFASISMYAQRDGGGGTILDYPKGGAFTATYDVKDPTKAGITLSNETSSGGLCDGISTGCLTLSVPAQADASDYAWTTNAVGSGGTPTVTYPNAPDKSVITICANGFSGYIEVCVTAINACGNSEGQSCETIVFQPNSCDQTVVLPSDCVDFAGNASRFGVSLNWTSVNERNSKHYEIQRSLNGVDFIAVGRVNSKNTTARNSYSYVDKTGLIGGNNYYYRLVEIDANGASKQMCNIVNVKFNVEGGTYIGGLSPNPTSGGFDISVISESRNQYSTIRITDSYGKTLVSETVVLEVGSNSFNFDISSFPSAVYYVVVNTGNNTLLKKIVKH